MAPPEFDDEELDSENLPQPEPAHASVDSIVACVENRHFEIGIACLRMSDHSVELSQFCDDQAYSKALSFLQRHEPRRLLFPPSASESVFERWSRKSASARGSMWWLASWRSASTRPIWSRLTHAKNALYLKGSHSTRPCGWKKLKTIIEHCAATASARSHTTSVARYESARKRNEPWPHACANENVHARSAPHARRVSSSAPGPGPHSSRRAPQSRWSSRR